MLLVSVELCEIFIRWSNMFMLLHDCVNRIVIMNVIVMMIVRTTLVAVNKGDVLSGLYLTISWREKNHSF